MPVTEIMPIKYFKKIEKETGVTVSTQIMMYRKGYIIKKCEYA